MEVALTITGWDRRVQFADNIGLTVLAHTLVDLTNQLVQSITQYVKRRAVSEHMAGIPARSPPQLWSETHRSHQ